MSLNTRCAAHHARKMIDELEAEISRALFSDFRFCPPKELKTKFKELIESNPQDMRGWSIKELVRLYEQGKADNANGIATRRGIAAGAMCFSQMARAR
jgi:hypothetical protein